MSMEYEPSYHLKCRLVLSSGRAIVLKSLRQWMTYGGWLEGVPSKRFNDRFVETAVHKAQENGGRAHLLPPRRRAYLREPGDMDSTRGFQRSEPEWLPP